MDILCQRDARWKDKKIGDLTIGAVGCTSTVLAECIGVTPDVFVDRMKAVGGYSGNYIIWAKVAEAFPGITLYRYWSYDNAKVLAFVPQVVVEVPAKPIGGTGSHWVRYMGNKRLHDPWTGTDRPTSDFPNPTGFAVIQGQYVPPQMHPTTLPEPNPGYAPTFEGQDVMSNGLHYKAYKKDGVLLWKIEPVAPPVTPPTGLPAPQEPPTPPSQPPQAEKDYKSYLERIKRGINGELDWKIAWYSILFPDTRISEIQKILTESGI